MKNGNIGAENSSNLTFLSGIKEGLPIALGYIPIAITFGLLSNSADIPNYISIIMSVLVFAGASQFVAVKLLALGTSIGQIILTTFIINLRHFLMTASISQRIKPGTSKKLRSLLAFGITDETFSVSSLRPEEELAPYFILGLNLISYSAWVGGTALGVFLGTKLPPVIQSSMGIALYAMFIGLLIPSIKESIPLLTVALLAMAINANLNQFTSLSEAGSIIITTMIASLLGALLFSKEEEK
ncbi:AzlC family ABC transporter permease [Halanaerocella petrolearia]